MAKQLNVNLAFTADTAKAKAQIAELYKTLNQVSAGSTASPNLFNTQKLKEGVTAAKELQQHLNAAVDVNTGKLNLSAFSASLKSSGKSLADYKAKLEALGPAGENAFLQVSRSIATADAPLRKTSSLLREFSTTMKNTARWQLSSSILHGFMGAVQSAVGYTQDLNESLNNIRIVTGNNTEEMAKFAKEANRAAKALSTTTTEYTNASLIYYQQGLNEQQVKERTDITIKMANVARESAETVSDQLTAVWNNFYENGSQPLEHYADAMTALGAATASSTDEIAGGLEKFASIADMIGLSFDNAAAALATITATTRQSEEVVGTALKTIFARIQGLSLGETLEDGTNLNKYSEALNKVGISIYDAAGGLKDMDNILAEMGAKWETLNKDQQVALAQTVAGVRQYNQLVSLMDNFDFYEQNLMTAQTSDGALNAQAEIYAESWEAARDRVTAAAENIYDSLLDDKFFIKLTDGFGTLLEGVGGFVDGLGGMEGVLSMLGGFITQKLAKEAPAALETIKQNLMQISGKAHEIANQTQKNNIVDLKNEAQSSMSTFRENEGSLAYAAEASVLEKIATLKNQLNNYQNQYSEAEIRSAQAEIDHLERTSELLVKKGERYDSLNSEVQQLEQNISQAGADYAGEETSGVDGLLVGIRDLIGQSSGLKTVQSQISNLDKAFKNPQVSVQDLAKQLYDLSKQTARTSTGDIRTQWRQVAQELAKVKDNANLTEKELKDIINNSKAFSNLESDIKKSDNALTDLVNELKAVEGMNGKAVDQFVAKLKEMGIISSETQIGLRNVGATFEGLKPHVASASEAIMSFSGTLMQANAFINSMTSLGTVFKDEDATTIEKLGAVVGALTSAFMMFNAVSKLTTTLMALQTGASKASSIALFLQAAAGKAEALATMQSTGQKGANIAATIAQTAANWGLNASMASLLIVTLALAAAVAVLVLAITGVVAIFKAIKAASPEGQLEALKEKAERSAEAFNRVQEAVNTTKDALEGLKSSYEAIDKLTKGTNEWYEAITNANAEVIKLMEKYPQLANEIYTTDDGLLKITQKGIDSIQTEDRMRLQAASNINTSNQIAVKEKEIDNSLLNFKDPNQIISDSYDYSGTIASAMQQYYESAGVGDQLFTRVGSDALLEGLKESAPGLFDDGYGNERYIDPEAFYETVMANEAIIRENAAKRQQINVLEDSVLTSRGQAVGSNRNAQEIRDIIGEDTYSNIKEEKRADVSKAFGDWNDRINYKESNAEWDMIQDFMDLQGENVEYVAQRKGKMVLEVDGEEIEYTKDEVYNALAELYSGPDLEAKLEEGLENSLKNSLGYSVENLDLKNLTAIDNFHTGLTEALAGTEYENESDSVFKSVMDQYSTSTDGIEAFQADTQYIDLTSEAFLRQAVALNKGKINAEQFASAVGELNAQGQILSMGSYFTNAAEGMGLDEEAAQDMQDYAEHLRSIAKDSEMLADSLAEDADSSADLAVEITRMNKGIDDLADGFSDWKDILKKSSKESAEYAKAMKQTKSALADVMDVEEDLISNDFVEDHLEEISKAAEGDAEAIDFLRSQMDEEIIANITLGQSDEFIAKIHAIDEEIKNNIPENIEVGAIINDGAFYEAAAKMVEEAGMTADEANAYFAGMGYEPVYNTEEIDNSAEVPNSLTKTSVESIGWEEADVDLGLFGTHQIKLPAVTTRTESIPEDPSSAPGVTRLTSFSGDGKAPPIAGLRKKATGSQNNYSKQNSGGQSPGKNSSGGNKGSKPKKVNKSDIVDRYKEITDQIDNLQDEMSDASKEADRLYGKDKLSAMKRQNSLMQQEIGLLKKKKEEALKYLEIDREALKVAAEAAGVEFTFDGDEITNYTDQMTILYDRLNALTEQAGETVDESEQAAIDELQEKIDELKKALGMFEETRELIEDLDNDIQDKIYEWQDNNYEQLQYALELKIEVDEDALRYLELKLKQYENSFYKMAESAAILGKDEVANHQSQLRTYESHKAALDAAYAAGEISQADYIDGVKEVRDGIYEQVEALIDLDDQMMHYYRDTLEAASEELSIFTDHMEHLTGVFDHYLSLMDILGKSKDYEAMGNFLGGKAENIRNELEVAQEYYEMLKANSSADEYWNNYQSALVSGDEDMATWWKEQWDAEVDALDEAQEEMLSLTEEWAEAMKAVIENNMNQISETLEKSLTDGLGFERLMDNFEKLNTRQEEYLTKTNQIYETNKLMRTASKALDETDNKVAKQKLKNFIDETKSLQQNTQLSQYELEIQQAKYDLLLAEIALEEAQNAKSTVRLSRDSEGNFGYIYTADQDAIADAEQGVEDAENNLYNISLEGQKTYTEKYLQAQQEMYNSLAELQQAYLNGEIATEAEFKARQAEIINHYYGEDGVLTTYSHLYNTAVQTDAAATADYWGKEYGNMTQDTANWKEQVDQYLIEIQEQTSNWKEVSEQCNEDVQGALEDSETATKELKEESKRLREELTSQVIPAINAEITAVKAQTQAYAAQRSELLQLIATYQQYLAAMNTQVAKANVGFDKNTDYSAVINDYLAEGGSIDSDTYKQLLAQRDAKIEWLKTEEGGNKDEKYWGTSGEDTTKMYEDLLLGGGDQDWFKADYFDEDELKKKLEALGIAGYATGGYTGDWGPSGKLAVLHEKELVLNSDDTSNLLKTVGFIREIISMIDSQASMSSLFSMSATSGVTTGSETLEQTVTIHAEFPNAVDHNEIEEAFNNLINTASQYANRK